MMGITSIHSSVKYVDCHKVKEQFVQIFYTIRKSIYSSSLRQMVDEELIVCQL